MTIGGIPYITFDSQTNLGKVYELSKEDEKAIDEINQQRKRNNSNLLLRLDSYNKKEGGRSEIAVCEYNLRQDHYKEFYDALNKIKPISEREIVEVWGYNGARGARRF